MHTFGKRLKHLRLSNDITQKQLAETFKITERGYQNYELGKSTPNFNVLISIADYFNVSLDYLVGRSNDPKIHN